MNCMDYYYGLWWTCGLLLYIIMDCMDYYYGLLYPIIIYCMSYYGVYGICIVYAFRLLIYIVWDECHINLLMAYVNVIFVFWLNKKQGKLYQNFLPHVKSCSTSIACSFSVIYHVTILSYIIFYRWIDWSRNLAFLDEFLNRLFSFSNKFFRDGI
jgi:hypothetical protein